MSLAASLLACRREDKAGIVLRIDAENEALRSQIVALKVTVGEIAKTYQSTSLPGDLGITTSPGTKQVTVEGLASAPIAEWRSDKVVAEAGKVAYYDVLLTAIVPGGNLDGGTDDAGTIGRDGAHDIAPTGDHPADDSGAGGTGGTGGGPGTGGASGGGGVIGSGGVIGVGGVTGRGGSNPGGAPGTGGMTNSGGASATGGSRPLGGATGSGGFAGVGGSSSTGGTRSSGGTTGSGGTYGTGGVTVVAGAPGTGGSTGTGGATSSGGTPGKKFVGNIDTRGAIRDDFVLYWNQLAPENAGKWGSIQGGGQSSFNWSSLDAMYKYCTDHNLPFVENNFIWGSQQPQWTSSLTSATGPAAVQTWMKSFCGRYPNTRVIRVVDEPSHTSPSYVDAVGGAGTSGYDWIVNAFKWARDACGAGVVLILNDYNNIEIAGDMQRTIDIVTAIQKAGAPIDAVGCEAHTTASMTSSTLKTNIDKLASATGLPLYITEYDINIADDARQQAVMQDQFPVFWNDDNVKGITLWGYIVGATWLANSGLMTSSGTMRPAMSWLMSYLGR